MGGSAENLSSKKIGKTPLSGEAEPPIDARNGATKF